MQLKDYKWSLNPRGMHNEKAFKKLDLTRYKPIQLGWMKLVAGGEEYMPDCQWFLSNNITPIIRIYRENPGAMAPDEHMTFYWKQYASVGVKWFEFYNEPNLASPEWPPHSNVSHKNINGVIRPMSENWLKFAENVINLGCYPAFPALAEAAGDDNSAVLWMDALLTYLRDNFRDRFRNVMLNGGWCATHPYTLNHFYQEVPGQPTVPRPPAQMNGTEPGWHFEYPDDPLTQTLDPGRNVFTGPFGDPNGLIAMGKAFTQRIQEWFDLPPVPVVGTEGGIYPIPVNDAQQYDKRYPTIIDRFSHGEATVGMFNWIALVAPEWMFGSCMWKEDEYYNNNLPAIQRLQQVPAVGKGGVPLPGWETPVTKGPGPIHGEPTDHVILLAPGLDPNWFFQTGRAYWNRFRPVVTTTWQFIEQMPSSRSLAITVIATPDMIQPMTDVIKKPYPNILFDLIVARGELNRVGDVLNARVLSNRRFG